MNDSKIAVRYAKALFELGIENKNLDQLRKDMDLVAHTCSLPDVSLMLESPVVEKSKKKKLLTAILENSVQPLTLKFILLVAEQRREMHIQAISRNFIQRYRDYKGIKAAKITTAIKIDDEIQNQIKKVISEVFKSEVELATAENSELMGGFILRVGDEQIDASVTNKLNKLKREFLEKTI